MIKAKFKVIFKKVYRNKLNYIVCFLIGLCFSFSIMVKSLSYSAKEYYKNDVFNFVSYRVFSISNPENRNNLIGKLNSMKEIEGIFDSYGYMSPWYLTDFAGYFPDKPNPSMWLLGLAGNIETIEDKEISLSEKLEMVCPSVYLPYTENGNPIKDKEIDLSKYLGKYITFQYVDKNNPKDFKIKLVGLYENDKIGKNYDKCYMNYKALEKINKEVLKISNNNVYYQLKNIYDEQNVTNNLREMGYYPEPIIFLDRMPAMDSLDMLVYISDGIFLISIFIVLLIIYFNIRRNRKNSLINKAYGYSVKNLFVNSIFESLILFLNTLIFTFISLLLMFNVFKKIIPLYYTTFKKIEIIISPVALIQDLFLILVIYLLLNAISLILTSLNNVYNNINE